MRIGQFSDGIQMMTTFILIDSSDHKQLLLASINKLFVGPDAVDLCEMIMSMAKQSKIRVFDLVFLQMVTALCGPYSFGGQVRFLVCYILW